MDIDLEDHVLGNVGSNLELVARVSSTAVGVCAGVYEFVVQDEEVAAGPPFENRVVTDAGKSVLELGNSDEEDAVFAVVNVADPLLLSVRNVVPKSVGVFVLAREI